MQKLPFQIVVIDDDEKMNTRPMFIKLCEKYNKENIIWKETPDDGLYYVKDNLSLLTIIILDYDFGSKTKTGLTLFQDLQKESSLLYIILNTAKSIEDIPRTELKAFINNHLMVLVDKTDGYQETLNQVDKAFSYLNNRIDCVLEQWIIRHKKFKTNEPYLKQGKEEYSLSYILHEIRKDTSFGKEMSSKIIQTAITILYKDIDNLNTQNI